MLTGVPPTTTEAPPGGGGGGLSREAIIAIGVVVGLILLIAVAIPGCIAIYKVCCKRGEMYIDTGKSSLYGR